METSWKLFSWTVVVVTFLDHLNLSLISYLSPLLGGLFFPWAGIPVLTFLGFSWISKVVATLAGTMLFGWISGRFSPEYALRWSILGFSLTTCLMGCLPSYQAMGSLLYVVSFMGQCFFARGERVVARLYLVHSRSMASALSWATRYDVCALMGGAAASWIAYELTFSYETIFEDYGWRIPFWISSLLGLLIFFNRRKCLFSSKDVPLSDTAESFWPSISWIKEIIAVTGPSYVPYTLAFHFLPLFVPQVTILSASSLILGTIPFLILDAILVSLVGQWLQRHTMPYLLRLMHWVCLFFTIFGIPLFLGLQLWPYKGYVSLLRGCLVLGGILYSLPFLVWSQHFQQGVYQVLHIGMGCALGTLLLGQGTSFLCLFLYQWCPWMGIPGLYLSGICLLALWGNKKINQRLPHQSITSEIAEEVL